MEKSLTFTFQDGKLGARLEGLCARGEVWRGIMSCPVRMSQ